MYNDKLKVQETISLPNTNKVIAREGYDKGVKALQQKIANAEKGLE